MGNPGGNFNPLGEAKIRKFPRMRAEHTLAFRRTAPDGSLGPPQLVRTRTLGLGGLMFEDSQALEVDETVQVELVIGEQAVVSKARVVYAEPGPGGMFKNGLEFTEISEENRELLLACYLQQEYHIPLEQ